MQDYKIEVQKRELSDKKSFIKSLRQNKIIPGIYYSHNSKESIPFSVSVSVLREALKSDAKVYQINVGNKLRDVIIKSIQYHPISDMPLHIDLYGVDMDTKVVVKVPISIIGQAVGIKEGGVLNQNMTELDIECLPSNIPQNIEVDISNLSLGDAIRIENITISDQLTFIGDSDMLIASIVAPAKQEEIVELEEDLASDPTEEDSDGASENNGSNESESE